MNIDFQKAEKPVTKSKLFNLKMPSVKKLEDLANALDTTQNGALEMLFDVLDFEEICEAAKKYKAAKAAKE